MRDFIAYALIVTYVFGIMHIVFHHNIEFVVIFEVSIQVHLLQILQKEKYKFTISKVISIQTNRDFTFSLKIQLRK